MLAADWLEGYMLCGNRSAEMLLPSIIFVIILGTNLFCISETYFISLLYLQFLFPDANTSGSVSGSKECRSSELKESVDSEETKLHQSQLKVSLLLLC